MPLSVDIALRKAQSRAKNGDLASAEAIYKEILAKFPKNRRAIEGLKSLTAGILTRDRSDSKPAEEKVHHRHSSPQWIREEIASKK